MILINNGRSVSNIIEDVRKHFKGDIIVLVRVGDQLAPPIGFPVMFSEMMVLYLGSDMKPEEEIILIANGGTSAQLVPVLCALVKSGRPCQVIDLQRDGLTVLYKHP